MKKRGKPLKASTSRTDFVTSEFLQHHIVEDVTVTHLDDGRDVKAHRAVAKRNVTQRPLDQYLYQHNITDAQYLAGERFYKDWYLAGISPRMTANLGGVGGGGMIHATDRQQAARDRHNKALDVIGLLDRDFAIGVICLEQFVGGAMMKNRTTIRVRFDRLRDALDRLAKHYGIA